MKDFFSGVSRDYARFRPRYPPALFQQLADLAPARAAAWDCATGTGQVALGLAQRFARVVASDGSQAQLAAAVPHLRVLYVRAVAEAAPLPSASIDLVTIAQALHWLDIPRFWPEVRRVLTPGGVVAAWCYNLCRIAPAIDEVVARYYNQTLASFWTPERRLLEAGYRTVPFPFAELDVPAPDMTSTLTLGEFVGYLGTWSATERYRAAVGTDPLPRLAQALAAVWPHGESLTVVWPLSLRVGRV
jgi:SAM-dependent methyltransferase